LQAFVFNRGIDPLTGIPFVYHGDTLSYTFTATNVFEDGVSMMISDALHAHTEYVTESLDVTINGESVIPEDYDYDPFSGPLEYQSDPLGQGDILMISFDVKISDIAPLDRLIENKAILTVYGPDSDITILVTESNTLQVQVKKPIPAPATIILLGAGLLGMFVLVRRRRKPGQ
jgi:hypothetical protein